MQKILITETFVKTPEEALHIVKKLQKSGECDIFRGQQRNWPLNSSLSRLSENDRKRAYNRLNNFAIWVNKNPELDELIKDKDKILSVAQHYGIPTSFIDFSYDPEIAFFFATDYIKEGLGCIYCSLKEKIDTYCKIFKNSFEKVDFRLVELEVGNLWRLQSQKGLFLNAPISGLPHWEDFFPFQKILFEHKKELKHSISRDIIYPVRKSALEIKLDQYFREEQVQKGLNDAEKAGLRITLTPWDSNTTIFKNNEMPAIDPTWNNSENKKWHRISSESYSATVVDQIHIINIKSEKNIVSIKTSVSNNLKDFLENSFSIKNRAIKFKVLFHDNESEWTKTLDTAFNLFWDGVRKLPYSSEEMCEGFSNLAIMIYSSTINNEDYISDCFGEIYTFECIVKNSGHFRVTIPIAPFINAINTLLLKAVDSDLFPKIKKEFDLIYHIHDVRLLFNFDDFKSLFIRYIIPCQIIMNFDPTSYYSGDHDESLLVVFSPFEIKGIRSATSYLHYTERYRNEERIIAIHKKLTDNELIILMSDAMKKIEEGFRPITVTFSGYENDKREIFEISDAIKFCKRLLKLGFISIMEAATTIRELKDAYNPYTFGAFEIWLIAKKKMKKEIAITDYYKLFINFNAHLNQYNILCDLLIKSKKHTVTEKIIDRIILKGLLGPNISESELDKLL